ncbi:MAG: HDOD domain-containing protein [Gammaproteobacteria bacterium]|nr:HDOD domain-containing protein [Gammaproteobacteria bacterium]
MDVDHLVNSVSDLVSLPDVCLRVNALLEDPRASAEQIGEVVNYDPGLTARLLKIVNSAYYGLPGRIETVSRAITVIGSKDLQALILATSAVEAFKQVSTDLVDMEAFWHHSVFAGLSARNLAARSATQGGETLFVAGLLHDVGKLVMYHGLPGQSQEILARCAAEGTEQHQVEREVLGFDHATVGAALLQAWHLPDSLVTPVRFHHDIGAATTLARETALVNIADAIAHSVEPGTKQRSAAPPGRTVAPLAWDLSGLTAEVVGPTVDEVNLESFEMLEIVSPGAMLVV